MRAPSVARASSPRGGQDGRPTFLISACLIVRDEEDSIARALRSIKNAVDEVIVLDTDSQDRTPEVAAAEGAQVFRHAWQDDFAAARNESLRHARGKWIVYIDADEELVEPQPGALRRLCSRLRPAEAGANLTIHNPMDAQGQSEVVGEQWRLFRNVPGIHFEGRIHEQLRWPDGLPVLRPAASHGLWIRHWGYLTSGDLPARKGERNRRLLELSLAEEPHQPAHYFHLGRQYAWERDFAKALPALEQAIELWSASGQPADGYVPSMFSTGALSALRTEEFAKVLNLEARTPKQFVSAELLFVAGVAHAHLGQTSEAIERLNRAWQDASLARATGGDPSTWTWRPLLALSEIYEALGQTDQAREALKKALEFAPEREDLRAKFLSHRGGRGEVRAPGASPKQTSRQTAATPSPDLSRKRERNNDVFVSACMIVRNEEENLRRWLPLVRAAVDELIVVDTGSTDGTADVARELGAQVHEFPWCDDFAAARNESLRHATGDWILWIDADDELVEDSAGALRQLCHALPATTHGCWVKVESQVIGEGTPTPSLRQWRLFRNGLGLRFRGRVHEQLTAPPELGALELLEQDQVQVRHWGYASDPELMARKLERNRRLLQLSIADEPDEPFHHYSLGKQLVLQQDFGQALDALQRAIELWREHGQPLFGYVGPLFAVAACAALNVGRNDQALKLEGSCPANAVSSDLLYYAGIACQRLGRQADAVSRLTRAITDPSVRNATETDPATASWRPRLLLAQLCSQQGRRDEAYRFAIEAIDLMPEQPDVFLGGAAMAVQMGHDDDAVRICRRLLAGQADDATKARARDILLDVGQRRPELAVSG